MPETRSCRSRCANQRATEQTAAPCSRTAEESASRTADDIPMHRHAGTVTDGCDVGRQLWQLSRMMEEQNHILIQLLQITQERRQ